MQALNALIFAVMGLIAAISLNLVIGALFPRKVNAIQETIELSQGRYFLIGVVNMLFLAAILVGDIFLVREVNLPEFFLLPGLVVMAFFATGITIGLTSLSRVVAERTFADDSVLRRNIQAVGILTIAAAIPYLGWFLFFPYAALLGFGGFITVLFRRNKQPDQSEMDDNG